MAIHTFYRPDNHMLNMLINHMSGTYGVKVVDGHRFIATVEVTPTTLEFARNHPNETEIVKAPSYFGGYDQMQIGVSLSQFNKEMFERMTKTSLGKNITQFMTMRTGVPTGFVPTSVVGLYTNGGNQYCWVSEVTYTPQETEFIKLLDGFDFYYSYTDDGSVYKHWNNKWKEIEKAGHAMGLTHVRMNEIYRQLSNG